MPLARQDNNNRLEQRSQSVEYNLIQLDNDDTKASNMNAYIRRAELTVSGQPAASSDVINISLSELTDGEMFTIKAEAKKKSTLMDVIEYIDKCNQKHEQLMAQVEATRAYYKRVMYQ